MLAETAHRDQAGLHRETARRRTFAIISHPDAGKTTLTEKLLLYSGAVQMAGAVRGRKNRAHAASDWMEMERQRGISITSTALQFEHAGCLFNLLDTPGHQDFSEDTYRTLMAVDSAVMVLDSAKGIEPQTRKLFEVCRMRSIPILTFVNKLDHEGKDPLDLLDEIERVLGIGATPMNWPIGTGSAFQGVYDLGRNRVLRFERTAGGRHRAPVQVADIGDPELALALGSEAHERLREEVDLLAGAGAGFEPAAFLAGELTPVYLGSALNNFGIEPFLEALVGLAPPPGPRASDRGRVEPTSEEFSGFVFKVQANMDPRHRDRMAFLRVCSGRFSRDMQVYHHRLGRVIRMSRPHRLFAQDRETLEEAYPGDVVGLLNPGVFTIGDTVCSEGPLRFEAIPRFQPERFAGLRNRDVSRYKRFHKGLAELEEEGVIQVLRPVEGGDPVLAAVGELQFDVVVARLLAEYGVDASVDRLPYTEARWIEGDADAVAAVKWPSRGTLALRDREGRQVVLFTSRWDLEYCERQNPKVRFATLG